MSYTPPPEVLARLDESRVEAALRGLRERLTVVLLSGFGRTPGYNAFDGKDHWSVGSAMLLGAGVAGGRVVGATAEGQHPRTVDPLGLETLEDPGAGVRLRPAHIHHALRAHARGLGARRRDPPARRRAAGGALERQRAVTPAGSGPPPSPPRYPASVPPRDDEPTQQTVTWADGAPPSEPPSASMHLRFPTADGEAHRAVEGPSATVGSHPKNDLVVDHPTVSRFHCALSLEPDGVKVTDRGSLNGTFVDGTRVLQGYVRDGQELQLGTVRARFGLGGLRPAPPPPPRERFGQMVGRSPAMRRLFEVLARCAASDVTVLLQGETGVGKELCAHALHQRSPRSEAPFLVVDCASLPASLLESELFGHAEGAFTGADAARAGTFEAAQGGTVFLDEIGELPLELQPKLLRVLEQREVRRLGTNDPVSLDVRIVAATHRPLHAEVNAGTFREDLYYRVAEVELAVPPLRERRGDLPLLLAEIVDRLELEASVRRRLLSPARLVELEGRAWPGNVRQLRNYVRRAAVLEDLSDGGGAPPGGATATADPDLPWSDARKEALARFERSYLQRLLEVHDGNVSRAARAAGVAREYLHRLIRRHGLDR